MAQQDFDTSKPTLDELAIKHGTDKSSEHHYYTKVYEQFLESKRDEPLTVLELGWGGHEDSELGGSSAKMWRDYFPNATVVCIDIEEKTLTDEHEGIHFRRGSQSDPEFISQLAEEFGPFDLVVDDASHVSSLTIKSWQLLYPHLKDGALYICEDMHSSYHDWFYGKHEANPNPARPTAYGNQTALQYFHRIADEVNYLGRGKWDLFPERYWLGYSLEFVLFMYDLVIIKKREAGSWPLS